MCTCSTYTWRITAAKRRSPRLLLPQIATMRMTVLNFSFARKLQSKLSLPTSCRRCGLGFFSPKLSGSLLFRILAHITFLPPGIFRRWFPPRTILPALLPVYRNFGRRFHSPGTHDRADDVVEEKEILDHSSTGTTSRMSSGQRRSQGRS